MLLSISKHSSRAHVHPPMDEWSPFELRIVNNIPLTESLSNEVFFHHVLDNYGGGGHW